MTNLHSSDVHDSDENQDPSPAGELRVVPPGGGESLPGTMFKVFSAHVSGGFSIVERTVEPGVLVAPHVHARHDQVMYVLEGEFGVRIRDQELTAPAGTYVCKPRNTPHALWNEGPAMARLMEITTPGGFEKYFEEVAQVFASGDPNVMERLAEVGSRYGTRFIVEWFPEIMAKHQVQPPAPPTAQPRT